MNKVAKIEERDNVQSSAGSMMALIERAANSSDVDVEKLEKLLEMNERWEKSEAEKAFNRDFISLQNDLPDIGEGGQIIHKGTLISKYARWDEDINPVIKPILAQHGFTLSFETDTTDRIKVTAHLIHRDGHSRSGSFCAPVDKSGAKNEVQGMGSSVSYAKRYAAGPLLNLTMRGLDDDGAAAGRMNEAELIDARTQADIESMVDDLLKTPQERAAFTDWLKTAHSVQNGFIRNIPMSKAEAVIDGLKKKRGQS